MTRDDEELTGPEKDTLSSLAREVGPPPGLESRVIGALRLEGRLDPEGSRAARLRPWISAAAAALLFLGGWRLGRRPSPSISPRFALLLYESPRFAKPGSHAEEYAQWARGLRESGVAISGEELADESRAVPRGNTAAPEDRETLGGFFFVGARDIEAAVAIARSCPHARHGGRIEVRPVAGSETPPAS